MPTQGPNLDKLAEELSELYPNHGVIYCSLLTWFWIREACDGFKFQHSMRDDGPVFIYYTDRADIFYGAKILINNKIDHFKIRIKKVN